MGRHQGTLTESTEDLFFNLLNMNIRITLSCDA